MTDSIYDYSAQVRIEKTIATIISNGGDASTLILRLERIRRGEDPYQRKQAA